MIPVWLAVLCLIVPAALFVSWPLWRRAGGASLLRLPPDEREQLVERKRVLYRALREIDFEHDAGHMSTDDYSALRDRYEGEAAQVLRALDTLMPADPSVERPRTKTPPARLPWTRRPATLAIASVVLVLFGLTLGLGAARYSEPDPSAGMPIPGSRPLAPSFDAGEAPSAANAPRGPVTPELLQGMLQAARASLQAGRYGEAIQAYQAVLKRDPNNVDALTHLAVIVAVGGHGDAAIETLDRALAIEPNYPAALLYRGQVLYEVKQDYRGAVASWEKFLAVVPAGEEHARVAALVREAKAKTGGRP